MVGAGRFSLRGWNDPSLSQSSRYPHALWAQLCISLALRHTKNVSNLSDGRAATLNTALVGPASLGVYVPEVLLQHEFWAVAVGLLPAYM